MRATPKSMPPRVAEAADAICEFALISLREEFLRWDKGLNLGMAEMVWNFFGTEIPVAFGPGVADLQELFDVLVHERRTRWPELDFMVFDLDARRERGDVIFSFALSFDQGRTFQDCEMAWDPGPDPVRRN